MSATGTLFVVSAPSGAGKSTIMDALIKGSEGSIRAAVSHTTRAPRRGETNGIQYHFVSKETFLAMRDEGDFIEWAEVHGNFYGTSQTMLNSLLSEGYDVLHDIDVQGARQLRPLVPDALFVFILPPSMEELSRRLRGRGTDTEEVIRTRLDNALGEIHDCDQYDYVIVNDSLERAVGDFSSIIRASRLGVNRLDKGWFKKNFSLQEDV